MLQGCVMFDAAQQLQVTKYVEREILNHRFLMHPHIVQFKEVSGSALLSIVPALQPSSDVTMSKSVITIL